MCFACQVRRDRNKPGLSIAVDSSRPGLYARSFCLTAVQQSSSGQPPLVKVMLSDKILKLENSKPDLWQKNYGF